MWMELWFSNEGRLITQVWLCRITWHLYVIVCEDFFKKIFLDSTCFYRYQFLKAWKGAKCWNWCFGDITKALLILSCECGGRKRRRGFWKGTFLGALRRDIITCCNKYCNPFFLQHVLTNWHICCDCTYVPDPATNIMNRVLLLAFLMPPPSPHRRHWGRTRL